MKLCDVTQFYSPFSGGVKRYLREKIAYLTSATDHEHVLIVPGAKSECVQSSCGRVYTIRSPIISRVLKYRLLINLPAVDAIIARERPDLIESGDPYQLGWRAIRIGRARRIPVVGFYHSHFAETHGRTRLFGDTLMGFGRRYVRRLYNSFEATLVPSRALAALLENWGVRNVRTVALGVNTTIFDASPRDRAATRAELGISASRRLLLYVGRLSKEKNTRVLFNAFPLLNDRAEFELLVIGDGPERKHLLELQSHYGNVRWIRYCSDPAELARYYRSADLFVHPGTHETFGLGALESQACGTPVAGIRGSYMDEAILHDQTWWAEENSSEPLAGAIEAAFARDLTKLGRDAARRAREQFSWPQVFQRLLDIYAEVCSKYRKHDGRETSASLRYPAIPPQ